MKDALDETLIMSDKYVVPVGIPIPGSQVIPGLYKS